MRLHVVHAVPRTSSSYGIAEDGFTAAREIVAERCDVRWLNIHPDNDEAAAQAGAIPDCVFVLVRSDWLWLPTQGTDKALRGLDVPVGLLIAGSTLPPPLVQMKRYDVLFHDTAWYAQHVCEHPFAVQAFGIDTRVMRDLRRPERSYDCVMVGQLVSLLDSPVWSDQEYAEELCRRSVASPAVAGCPARTSSAASARVVRPCCWTRRGAQPSTVLTRGRDALAKHRPD